MNRFFVKGENNNLYIDNVDDIKHLKNVLRLKIKDQIEAVDEKSEEYLCEIIDIQKDKIPLQTLEKIELQRETKVKVTVYQGVPKGQKMDEILQKTTELGVSKIVPVELKRCVKTDFKENQYKRLEKIIKESAMQSKRNILPILEKTHNFDEMLQDLPNNELNIVLYEEEKTITLKQILKEYDKTPKTMGIIIGPEGGIAQEEIEELKKNNIKIATLGNRILRTQTVAVSVISMINFFYEE